MNLKVYADRLSQPSRAIVIFCKLNGIDFEEVRIDLTKRQHRSPEFKEINPIGQVPAIVDGRFKLFESHAILRYLACAFPGVSDHWAVRVSLQLYRVVWGSLACGIVLRTAILSSLAGMVGNRAVTLHVKKGDRRKRRKAN